MTEEAVKEIVKKTYARVATSSCDCCGTICCNVPFKGGGNTLARMLGYDVKNMPEPVIKSFAGCGNPVALSDIKQGETVLDLGSGAGLDAFIVAQKVGDSGKVIGLDITPEMIKKANENACKLGLKNVEFMLGDIEAIPIKDESIDVIISNCVINLIPDKYKAFKEAYKVLKPNGRMFISDMVINGKLPDEVRESIEAYTACIGGALEEQEYIQKMKDAGFVDV
ncbi:MAG: arsenite methyltransferase, partial [Candidatus Bathyarchaeia archaeon]